MHFHDISYLKTGSQRQQAAYATLQTFSVFEKLSDFTPFLAGTIPIGVDIETSDLDILCCFGEIEDFAKCVFHHFGSFKEFKIARLNFHAEPTIIANFIIGDFPVEVFGQKRAVEQQEAYRHLIAEHALLQHYGETLRQAVISLKTQGIKTEPAFAQALGLKGDPYDEILKLKIPLHPAKKLF